MKIHYTKQGRGQALVLFHGWGFDSRVWDKLLPDLSQDFQVFCFDLPGFGASSKLDWQDFKKEVLEALPQQFSLLGWSLGGLYASRLAIEHSEAISHLINVASTPYFMAEDLWPGVSPSSFDGFYQQLIRDPQTAVKDFTALQCKGQIELVQGRSPQKDSLEAGLRQLKTWDFREPLKTFTKPTHYMFGRLDAITPFKLLQVMEDHYPHFDYTLFKRSAHMPFLSEQNEFINTLKEYLL